jgi:hypothetical protein
MKTKNLRSDLDQILKIRRMRADSLRRAQIARQLELNKAGQHVVECQDEHESISEQVKRTEAEEIAQLMNGEYIKIHRIEAFSRLQLGGIKQIENSRLEIEVAHKEMARARENLEEAINATRAGEKKLIAIEEATREDAWK